MAINFAILGTGRIADNALAPALGRANGARLWSVLSRNKERARSFADSHGAQAPEPAYTDLDALLADPELHAVVISSPDALHAEQAIAAAQAGKHVLTEKPMATSIDECRPMVDACAQARVQLGVAYHMRWHTGHRRIAELAEHGHFGELRHVRVHWSWRAPDATNWRADEDMGRWWGLSGVGTHCLDQIRWLLCPTQGEVAEMSSTISKSVFKGPHDETALLGLRFENGATAQLCSSVLWDAPKRMEVYGTRGFAYLEDTLGPHGRGRVTTHEGPLEFEPRDPYIGEIEDFVGAIRENRPPEVDGEEGMRNVELLSHAVA
ncbi:MAG: Gfo/Idh/MocA family oxidoreductase [Chromatiales bacterium]|jgi:predicted dehydrogenase|nr:Gfo/Idh/MocA family oxidoreductase [Chromatiales bacterium]